MPILAAAALIAALTQSPAVDVRLVTGEAEAVMTILDKRAAHQPVTEADWQRLFTSEGFVRLQKRENSMHRSLTNDEMRTFVMSDDLLARRETLGRVLGDWKHADMTHAASLALAYLPPNAKIRAKIYPVIKPQKHSFVFETDTNPAIFKYIEEEPRSEFERTMAHELHHVGFSACGEEDRSKLRRTSSRRSTGSPHSARATRSWQQRAVPTTRRRSVTRKSGKRRWRSSTRTSTTSRRFCSTSPRSG